MCNQIQLRERASYFYCAKKFSIGLKCYKTIGSEIKRSSQLRTLLKRVVDNRTWKKFRPVRDLNPNWFMRQPCVRRDMKHLRSLEGTQEARVALGYASSNSYASFVLSKLLFRVLHISMNARWRMNYLLRKFFFLEGFVCWCHERAQ